MISVHVVYFWENNSPAFELLQLTVVQHASHVLIHLLQIGKKFGKVLIQPFIGFGDIHIFRFFKIN